MSRTAETLGSPARLVFPPWSCGSSGFRLRVSHMPAWLCARVCAVHHGRRGRGPRGQGARRTALTACRASADGVLQPDKRTQMEPQISDTALRFLCDRKSSGVLFFLFLNASNSDPARRCKEFAEGVVRVT